MDCQVVTRKRELERILFYESTEAKVLSLSLLKSITDNFSDNLEIGRGGFAVVYKGLLGNVPVAVKKLSKIDEEKFSGEVSCLMNAKHKNIVRFLGYCSDTQGQLAKYDGKPVMADFIRERLLCFEYLPNGSLDKYIKDPSREWRKCYQIIKGVCQGLHYLHKERIVHSDLKPANILLDNDMVPKITDFGLSRCFDETQTHAFTSNLIGSWGYLAPEFGSGKISFKSDIYSLGVIIIEMLTAEKGYPVVEDVLECWRHKVEKSQQLEQIRVCTELAKSCLECDPAKRPCAQGIIDILKQTESKEPCIETGASGSAVPPASSLVENKNKSTRQRNFKIEAFKSRGTINPEIVAKTSKAVTQAISEFYAQGSTDMSVEELYRGAYNMVLHRKGEELYSTMETAMISGVQSLCRPLDAAPADGTLFLQELLAKWNRHIQAVNSTRDILMYMDRTYTPTNHKTPIKELGLRLWRDHIARSDKIRERLIEAVKRQGGSEDDELVAGVNKMLAELGEDVPGLFFPDGELHVTGP